MTPVAEGSGLALLVMLAVLSMVGLVRSRRRREEQDARSLASSQERRLHLPPTLHPLIDAQACIGCLSCVEGCPERGVLGVVDGKAALIRAASCIGHGRCAVECPVGAITLVFGSEQRGLELPQTDPEFESSRKGVHVVGELGGMGLIKNALAQGLELAQGLGERLRPAPAGEGDRVDVAVVGAGPAGLATALGLKQAGLTFRVLEQGSLGGTIAHYPRHKVVMTEKVVLPFHGSFGRPVISKEELLELWQQVTKSAGLQVETGVTVAGVEGEDGNFVLQTSHGPVRARKVVLATGRCGSPRKLGVPGEALDKVSYRLVDAEQYAGARVLVVGGGDSAVEAVLQLAEQPGTDVTLSYRSPELSRCREANRTRLDALAKAGRVKRLLPSEVQQIEPDQVVLSSSGQQVRVANDFVLICIGGELPSEFLAKAGVDLQRHFGTPVPDRREKQEALRHRRLVWALTGIGVAVTVGLAAVGWDYYGLTGVERLRHPLHELLRPAGVWGHGIGIVATLVMLSNFLYAVRKRWKRLKGKGPIKRWLTFHQFVGLLSPVVICFHTAFQSNNHLATTTAAALAIVVVTGLVGRFLYGLVPTLEGKVVEHSELLARWRRLAEAINPLLQAVPDPAGLRGLLQTATRAPQSRALWAVLARFPFELLATAGRLRGLRGRFQDPSHYVDFRRAFWRLVTSRVQVEVHQSARRMLSLWRVLHVVLAVLLVVVIAAHIGVSLYLGYRWVLS